MLFGSRTKLANSVPSGQKDSANTVTQQDRDCMDYKMPLVSRKAVIYCSSRTFDMESKGSSTLEGENASPTPAFQGHINQLCDVVNIRFYITDLDHWLHPPLRG
jgi:hypothetical protein